MDNITVIGRYAYQDHTKFGRCAYQDHTTVGRYAYLDHTMFGRCAYLDIILCDAYLGGVDVVYERLQCSWFHLLELDAVLAALLETCMGGRGSLDSQQRRRWRQVIVIILGRDDDQRGGGERAHCPSSRL